MSPDTKAPFWTFNLGHPLSIAAILLSAVAGLTLLAARLEGHEDDLQGLKRPEIGRAALASRLTVLATLLDVVQAQLPPPNMTANRTRDTVQAIREDIAVLTAGQGN